jgi:uracil phosphoribosyltransferase
MTLTVVSHPLAEHLLARLRDRGTPPPVFRAIAKQLTLVLVVDAVRGLPTRRTTVETPLERTEGAEIDPNLVAVPILRAGLGMLEAVTELFPEVSVGYVGLERDDETLEPTSYYEKLPPIGGRHVLLLDPMLATGGTAAAASSSILEREPAGLSFVCIVAAPEGVARMERLHPRVPIVTAALDRQLDDRGYILPGLGDFGDRLFGTDPHVGARPR